MRKRDRIREEGKLITCSLSMGFFIGIVFMTFVIASAYTSNEILIEYGVADYDDTGELYIIAGEEEVYV